MNCPYCNAPEVRRLERWGVCTECDSFSIFDQDGGVREPTTDELNAVPAELSSRLLRLRVALRLERIRQGSDPHFRCTSE